MNRCTRFKVIVMLALAPLAPLAHAGDPPAGGLQPPPGPVAPSPGPNSMIIIDAQNTPGDATSRFIISQPGSYRLGHNLGDTAHQNQIRITAPNVSINGNAHAIQGSDTGTGIVIDVPNTGASTVSVENMFIYDKATGIDIVSVPDNKASSVRLSTVFMSSNGIGVNSALNLSEFTVQLRESSAGAGASIGFNLPGIKVNGLYVGASNNGSKQSLSGTGIRVGEGSTLEEVHADDNGNAGIVIKGGAVTKCTANGNGAVGVDAGASTEPVSITSTDANRNTNGWGIKGKKDTTVNGGSATGNTIGVEAGSVSGCDTSSNSAIGTKILSMGRVRDTRSEGNLCGFFLDQGARAMNCSAIDNQTGVIMSDASQLWLSTVSGSTGNGVEATGWVLIDSVSAINNAGDGINMQQGRVNNTWAAMNTGNGINGGDFLHVTNTAADGNGVRGIAIGQLGEVSGCCVHSNGSGILVAGGSRVMRNIIAVNGIGVEVNGSATLDGNTVSANTNGVIVTSFGSASQITGNVIKSHASGSGIQLQSTATTVLRNSFSGNMTDVEELVSGNKIAPIQCDPATAGPHDNWEQ